MPLGAAIGNLRDRAAAPFTPRPPPITRPSLSDMRLAIQVVLALVIAVLAFLLYRSITVPYEREQARIETETIGRERMDDVRSALISYRDAYSDYPSTLDSLVMFVRQDSAWTPPSFEDDEDRLTEYASTDSLIYSARGGQRFNYDVVQQTDSTGAPTGVEIYWLQDPGVPGDSIGSHQPNPALRNAASWLE